MLARIEGILGDDLMPGATLLPVTETPPGSVATSAGLPLSGVPCVRAAREAGHLAAGTGRELATLGDAMAKVENPQALTQAACALLVEVGEGLRAIRRLRPALPAGARLAAVTSATPWDLGLAAADNTLAMVRLKDGRRFLWLSERSGFAHVSLCDLTGACRAVTQGPWMVDAEISFTGGGPATAAVAGGHVKVLFAGLSAMSGMVAGGLLKPIAIASNCSMRCASSTTAFWRT